MPRITPDLARLLVAERLTESEQRRSRRTPPPAATPETGTPDATPSPAEVTVPRQRRGSGVLAHIVPRGGVRIHSR